MKHFHLKKTISNFSFSVSDTFGKKFVWQNFRHFIFGENICNMNMEYRTISRKILLPGWPFATTFTTFHAIFGNIPGRKWFFFSKKLCRKSSGVQKYRVAYIIGKNSSLYSISNRLNEEKKIPTRFSLKIKYKVPIWFVFLNEHNFYEEKYHQ